MSTKKSRALIEIQLDKGTSIEDMSKFFGVSVGYLKKEIKKIQESKDDTNI